MSSPSRGKSGSLRSPYTIYVCPECSEQITDSYYDPARGAVYGHYHDPPADWPGGEDPWFDATPLRVVPVEDRE